MSKLVIVESPAKAKTIGKYLGENYEVKASVGHVRDLPKSNKDAIDIEGGFIPRYQIVPGKEKVIIELRRAASDADEVILATDPDREGEAIAWHVSEALRLKDAQRIVFYEITKEAVHEALKHPRGIDERLKEAQEARRVLDRLVGYDLSGLIWKKVRYGLSAGRVQSPALRIIMEREREIRAFKPETFYVISALLHPEGKEKQCIAFTSSLEPKTKEEADKILESAQKGSWSVIDVEEKEQLRAARAPFTTSTLQQAASSELGFAPSRTMRVAQRLYEAGHITYMRTDSTALAKTAQDQILSVIEKEFGKEYVNPHVYTSKSKNAQEAHEAIRPTSGAKKTAGATPEQKKLYDLIRRRTLSSQMLPARILRTKVIAKTDDVPDFVARGARILFPGWYKADPGAKSEETELPKVSKGDTLILHSIDSEEKETQPPPRYSEAGLIKELEKRGIGRPSTYASIVETLLNRDYVVKEGRALMPTDTGDVVSSFLEENFTKYISDSFTSEMEDELDEIACGERQYEKTLRDFYTPFLQEVREKTKNAEKITTLGEAPKKFPCPVCGKPMVIKLGKAGKFMSCSTFPKCAGARTIEGVVLPGPKETGEACPECREGRLIERDGRYGRFVACNRYPKCKYIKKDAALDDKNKTGVTCPLCNTGEIMERRGRFGPFYSCSRYPECAFSMKARPTGNTCELCGSLMMQGTKTIPERCSNKDCSNHNPHKKK